MFGKPKGESSMNNTKHYRQGDVLVDAIETIPVDATPVKPNQGRIILAWGEVTGHHHSIATESCEMYEKDGNYFIHVKEPANLDHQEHSTINIPAGDYAVTIQREYTPTEIRRVLD
jgi:hypothetical protein